MIEGDGTPESRWRACPVLASTPRVPVDEWLAPAARLVVIAPHPDDEVLACGALIHLHDLGGGAVLVVAVTDGEASHAGSSFWKSETLAEARRIESANGLSRLASRSPEVVRLGLPDGSIDKHIDALAAQLGSLLRPDDVVVTTWHLDGHPDHEACGRAAAMVCAGIGCRLLAAPVWMWHWASPADERVPWNTLRAVAISPEAANRKRRALAAHVTQLVPRDTGEGAVLTDTLLGRLDRDVEYFFV